MLALQLGRLLQQLLVLPAQPGLVLAQCLDLRLQLEQAAPQLGRVFAGALIRLLHGVHALAQLENGTARLVVTEQRGMAAEGRGAGQGQQRCTEKRGGHHQR
ncbi:hypothetical protein D3C81_2049090 [compost metagenome]